MYSDEKGMRRFRHFNLTKSAAVFKNAIPLDCGKCLFCRKKKAYELACRCVLHASLHKRNCFITLTYDEKLPTYHNTFEYSDIQKFKKRLRKKYSHKKIDIFNVHEYGENGKKHWHLIIFNHDFSDKCLHTTKKGIPLYTSKTLAKLWPFGFNTIGDVTEASAMYQASYMKKDFKHDYVTTSKKSHSQHRGIGKPYFLKHYSQILSLGFIPLDGKKMPIPRYFEKLAHRHYCHFYDTSAFTANQFRNALYRPFPPSDKPDRVLADLYRSYRRQKDERILTLQTEWNDVISQFLTTNETPDFIKSAANAMYDLRKNNQPEFF